ncbi:MAG TPA: hypothetical protein VFC41_01460 [Anaerovoracaceae bacterium]|nr:hypothetical protein [Anaerovoracaceae bacterium]
MRVPRRISEILTKKQDFINMNRDRLESSVLKLQSKLLDTIIAEVIPSLDIKDGVILDTTHNYRILADLDKVYKDFTILSGQTIGSQVISTTNGLINLGRNYFAVAIPDIVTRFDRIIELTASKMNARIGITQSSTVSGGFLDSIIKDGSVNSQIKNFVSKSITGQINMKDFIKGLGDLINGVPHEVLKDGVNTIIQTGALEKQYQRYAYDLYQQYDRAYNVTLADEFEMKYFLYQGGLIDDSRDFCVCHNNKVWSTDESADWDTWKPYMGEYPEGYTIKQKDIYDIPSYLGYPGYQPLIDFGGYRCRHSIGFISDELAFELRPELKGTQ